MMFKKMFRITTLEDAPERRQETLELIERAFKYNSPHQFAVDFFPLMAPGNAQNCHIVIDSRSERVVGHISVLLRRLGNHLFQANTAILGGIAVDPDFQRQGIMGHLIRYLIKEYEEDIALFFLWSDLHDLYSRYNFFPAGGQIQLGEAPLDEALEAQFEKTKFSSLTEQDKEQIRNIYQEETLKWHTSFIRADRDWQNISHITSTDLYLKRNDAHEIIAYFFANKGFDLGHIIHEIGFHPNCKTELLEKMQNYRLWLPEQEKLFFPQAKLQFMALIRVGSTAVFAQLIRQWSQGEIAVQSIHGRNIIFKFQNEEYREDIQHFLTIVFGPSPVKEFEKFGPPLYLSGLDSV